MGRGFRLALAVMFATTLCAVPTRAQSQGEQQARSLFLDANEQLEKGDYTQALDKYRAAYALWQNPKILVNMGTSLRHLGRNPEAVDTYERYLRDPAADPKRSAEIQAIIQELNPTIGRLTVVPSERDAKVVLNGEVIANLASPVPVEPGIHVVIVEKAGFASSSHRITLNAGESLSLPVRLVSIEKRAAVPNVSSSAQAEPPVAPKQSDSSDDLSPIAVVMRADIDARLKGGLAEIGLSYMAASWMQVDLVGLTGRRSGVQPGVTVRLMGDNDITPTIRVGVPIILSDGRFAGGLALVGVEFTTLTHLGLRAEAGMAEFPSAPDRFEKLTPVVALGAQWRL